MIGLLRPELLLLALPLALLWRRWGGPLRGIGALRLAAAALLLLAAAGPYLPLSAPGRDVVVVVDRSASMPAESGARAEEILRLLEDARGPGDRVGVVVFGASARVLRAPSPDARSSGLPTLEETEAAGSDLAGAMEAGLALLRGGGGRLLVISDGLHDGADPTEIARRAGARGVPVDVRPHSRSWGGGARALSLSAPAEVAPGAPLALAGWVQADRAGTARYTLRRGGVVIQQGETALKSGLNRLLFRDLAPESGLLGWSLQVSLPGDPTTEDDEALAATRVRGAGGVLVLNQDGSRTPLVRALEAGGLHPEAKTPEQAPLDAAGLASYRVVVLEDVAADRLGLGLGALAGFVDDGGGLLITGGPQSFGVGGYHHSSIDELLPVSMEQRVEQRKQGVAMVIAMDRSGSMAEDVGGGRTKMDLANAGAAAAIKLLSPMDHLGVMAVDTAAHEVVPLGPVKQPDALAARVLRVRSEGGGIYVFTALAAAAKKLEQAPQKNRHITLFADAADSEEQEGVLVLLRKLRKAGVTVSVIALGSKFDSDARFLESVAKEGGGTIAFTLRPSELPRLFAQDTLLVSRASVIEEPTGTAPRGELRALGLSVQGGPDLDGYNRTWPRSGALVGLVSTDENAAPILAWRQAGAGRTAAYMSQVGGPWGARALGWEPMGGALTSLTRWLGAQEAPGGWYGSASLEGQDLVITVEREPGAALDGEPVARVRDPDGGTREVRLEADGPDRWRGRTRTHGAGITLGVVGLGGDQLITLPAVASAGSSELRPPADPSQGERGMRRLATLSGGTVNAPVSTLLEGEAEGRVGRVLSGPLLGLGLLLALAEIAARRLWPAGLPLSQVARARAAPPTPAGSPLRTAPEVPGAPAPVEHTQENSAAPPASPVSDALARARERAGRRLDRQG